MVTHRFLATCPAGVGVYLAQELDELGADSIVERPAGVSFEGSLGLAYRACLWSRMANRIILELGSSPVDSADSIYDFVLTLDWAEHISPQGSLMVDFSGRSADIRNAQFGARRVKDAIVDQFRDTFGERPNVNTRFPDLQLNLYVHKNRAHISVDLGGGSLHKRGYRTERVAAPMQENIAATIIRLSEWNGSQPLFDPFCGSGTLLIEAAMKQTNLPAARFRSKFGFLRLPDFNPTLWNQIKTEANRAVTPLPEYKISGSDIDAAAIQAASTHIAMIPEGKNIQLQTQDFRSIESLTNHCIITNPPYGIRMETPEKTGLLLKEFGDFLKQKCTSSTAFVYFGDATLSKKLGLKPDQKWFLRTGGLKGILCRYPLY